MNPPDELRIAVIAYKGPALFCILKRIINALRISSLDQRLSIFEVSID